MLNNFWLIYEGEELGGMGGDLLLGEDLSWFGDFDFEDLFLFLLLK